MLQQDKVDKLVGWFVKAALRHAAAIEAMQETAAAAQADDLTRFYKAIRCERGTDRFLTLLDHPDAAVSGMAAVYAMREDPERCCAVLAKLAQVPGLIGFRAQVALQRWQAGEWPR